MKIIGTGFGRTGTMSLCAALSKIGFAPCYHVSEVFKNPSHIKLWQSAVDGELVDWQAFLGEYQSGLDYPIVAFYEDLMKVFPDAKVILTTRDADSWYESTIETIYYDGAAIPTWLQNISPFKGLNKVIDSLAWEGIFHGRFEERDYAIKIYNEHVEKVKATVPPEKLLVYSVKEGWQPLCEFLNVAVPDEPFPRTNHRQMTKTMFRMARIVPVAVVVLAIALIVYLLSLLF